MLQTLVRKMHLFTLWPWPWISQPQNIPLLVYLKVIPYTKFVHCGIIRFWVMLLTNRQTNRRDRTSYPRWPTKVSVGDNISPLHILYRMRLSVSRGSTEVQHRGPCLRSSSPRECCAVDISTSRFYWRRPGWLESVAVWATDPRPTVQHTFLSITNVS